MIVLEKQDLSVGFLITKHITKIQLLYYLTAEIIGALLASLFVNMQSLAPAVLSGVITNLWLYWTATFIGTSTVALLLKKFIQKKKRCQGRDDVKIK